jgi:transposase
MAKRGKELSDDTNKDIIKLIENRASQVIESGYRASQVIVSGYRTSQVIESGYRASQVIESGYRASQVAQSLKISKSTISRLLKRWRTRDDTDNIPRTRRKNIMTERAENTLSRVVKTSRRAILKDITAEFNECTPVAVSRRTVQRKLHLFGYTRRSVRMKIGIKTVNKKTRIAWCRGKLHWTVGNRWKKAIFTDEMMIIIEPNGELKVWRKSSEVWRPECLGYVTESPSTNLKIMVWGCLTYHGVGTLAMINGNMNSVKYIETLDNNLWKVVAKHFRNTPYLFQDDNAPCHRSRIVEEWKGQNKLTQLNWLEQSPDLTPIENVWLLTKNQIKNRLYLIRNIEDLKSELLRAWLQVQLVDVQSLYSSFPRRC